MVGDGDDFRLMRRLCLAAPSAPSAEDPLRAAQLPAAALGGAGAATAGSAATVVSTRRAPVKRLAQ